LHLYPGKKKSLIGSRKQIDKRTLSHIQTQKKKKNDRATVELATAKANLLHDDYTKRRKRKNTKNREYSPRNEAIKSQFS
jgi:hypothetical protein